MHVLRRWLLGLCAVLLAGSTLAGAARAAAPARIEAFDVERIAALQPGARLNFTVFGSPAAQVQLDIEGGRQPLRLRETDAGVYEGVYIVDAQDRIGAASRVVATLRSNDHSSVRAVLEEPLLLDSAAAQPRLPAVPPVAGPMSQGGPDMAPGALPNVSPNMAPSAASPSLPGSPTWSGSAVDGPSVGRPGTPAPSAQTAPAALPPLASNLPLPAQRPSPGWPDSPAASPAVPPGCRQCAIVEAIRSVETPPSRPPHSVAGNVLGALFGETVAAHVDRHVERVNTAIDRAVHGRAQAPLPATRYEVLLRLPDGRRLTRLYDAPPPFRSGDMLVLPEAALRAGQPSMSRGESNDNGGLADPAADSLAQGRW